MGFLDGLRGLLRSNDDLDSEERHRRAEKAGADAISACADRGRVTLHGTIDVLTVRPRRTTPWLEAELTDGTGRVTLIWMGRREIPGIEAGRELRVTGRISVADGVRRMYNPHYVLT